MAKKINEEVEETVKENKEEAKDFLDEKPKRSIGKLIFNIIFWSVVIILLVTWGIDYMNVRNNKKPSLCLSKQTHKYDDGTVNECVGLGYKVYEYNRSSMAKATEFVPFFVGIRESSK